jgi:hypothetical protein
MNLTNFKLIREVRFGFEFIYAGITTYPHYTNSIVTDNRRTCLVVPVILEGEVIINDYKFLL